MNATTVVLLLAAGMMLASPAALAKEIYTWTDENGVVHYVDKRPDNPEAKAMQAPEAYRPGSVSAQPADPEESSPDGAPGSEAADSPDQHPTPGARNWRLPPSSATPSALSSTPSAGRLAASSRRSSRTAGCSTRTNRGKRCAWTMWNASSASSS